ncbi:MAG: HAMP domain-containing protein [Bacteroidia bacterium]|nr:HAMP domain-containing protein [Bacteroidia bacterium]
MSKFRNVSIAKKLYVIVGAMSVLIIIELLTLWFSIHILSSVRASVGAEGLLSKAQKDAVYQLTKYHRTRNEADYKQYLKFMSVPYGDHITRMELLKANPDLEIAKQGFRQGRINDHDIDGMITLVQRFYEEPHLKKAINFWAKGDTLITQVMELGIKIHHEINSPAPNEAKLTALITSIDPLNEQLTIIEDGFSYTLGEGARWLENLILKILFSVALTAEITGLVMTIIVSRGITKGLSEINKATAKIAKGDMSVRAKVLSKDEIGQLAIAVNQMTGQLIRSNKELGQYAHIASHDLQEPLRTISNFTDLFQRKYKGQLDENADEYLGYILKATSRMQTLIRDLLDYSRIGHNLKLSDIDCNILLQEVAADMAVSISESNSKIVIEKLPEIYASTEIKLVFQNLISNAIKFRKKTEPLKVNISCKETETDWEFCVRDNGIGIEEQYRERIFVIFQKLHSQKEYAGTGIGLAHCKKIIEAHKGLMKVESQLGEGSNFNFTISKHIK